jgi:hypothetical protein
MEIILAGPVSGLVEEDHGRPPVRIPPIPAGGLRKEDLSTAETRLSSNQASAVPVVTPKLVAAEADRRTDPCAERYAEARLMNHAPQHTAHTGTDGDARHNSYRKRHVVYMCAIALIATPVRSAQSCEGLSLRFSLANAA